MQIKAILRNHTTLTEDSGEDVGEMGTFMGGGHRKSCTTPEPVWQSLRKLNQEIVTFKEMAD